MSGVCSSVLSALDFLTLPIKPCAAHCCIHMPWGPPCNALWPVQLASVAVVCWPTPSQLTCQFSAPTGSWLGDCQPGCAAQHAARQKSAVGLPPKRECKNEAGPAVSSISAMHLLSCAAAHTRWAPCGLMLVLALCPAGWRSSKAFAATARMQSATALCSHASTFCFAPHVCKASWLGQEGQPAQRAVCP